MKNIKKGQIFTALAFILIAALVVYLWIWVADQWQTYLFMSVITIGFLVITSITWWKPVWNFFHKLFGGK